MIVLNPNIDLFKQNGEYGVHFFSHRSLLLTRQLYLHVRCQPNFIISSCVVARAFLNMKPVSSCCRGKWNMDIKGRFWDIKIWLIHGTLPANWSIFNDINFNDSMISFSKKSRCRWIVTWIQESVQNFIKNVHYIQMNRAVKPEFIPKIFSRCPRPVISTFKILPSDIITLQRFSKSIRFRDLLTSESQIKF